MENSAGILNLENKTNKPHKSNITLIPDKKILQLFVKKTPLNNFDENFSMNLSFSSNNSKIINVKKLQEFNENIKKNKSSDLKNILNVGPEVIEKLEGKLDVLKEIFFNYSKLGEKLNFNKINLSSFIKFLKDCRVLYIPPNVKESDSNFDLFSTRNFSKSPLKSAILSNSNSMKSLLTNKKKIISNNNLKEGKIIESDATLMFTLLTGNKNFDNSVNNKNQFNKNKGFSMDFNESSKGTTLDQKQILISSKSNIPFKMDFNLFLKSFEVISSKLYPDRCLDESVLLFIENVIFLVIN